MQKIYDDEAQMQRPIMLEEKDKQMHITEEKWVQYLGNQQYVLYACSNAPSEAHLLLSAYGGFVQFFKNRVSSLGVLKALEQFNFSDSLNEKGNFMLVRLMSGA